MKEERSAVIWQLTGIAIMFFIIAAMLGLNSVHLAEKLAAAEALIEVMEETHVPSGCPKEMQGMGYVNSVWRDEYRTPGIGMLVCFYQKPGKAM